MMGPMTDESRRSRITLIALLAGVGLVVVIALIAVFARGAPVEYPEDTPEGVVQRYTQAVIDGDAETAKRYLAPDVAASCDSVPAGTDDYRITLLETVERDGTARVDVIVTTIYGTGPLGSSEYESEETFRLIEVDGAWRIETTPWQFTICMESGPQ